MEVVMLTRREALAATGATVALLGANMAVSAMAGGDAAFMALLAERERLFAAYHAARPEDCFEPWFEDIEDRMWVVEERLLALPVTGPRAYAEKLRVLEYELALNAGGPKPAPMDVALLAAARELRAGFARLQGDLA
jgi:hypothetical protein